MLAQFGMAHKLEELPLYEKIQEFWSAVFAILQRSALRSWRTKVTETNTQTRWVHPPGAGP
jgi:hypothetical protein